MPVDNPELRDKIARLRAMEFVLSGVIEKMGALSEYIHDSASYPMLLQWQMQFSEQMEELRKMIDEDMAKEELSRALQSVMSASSETALSNPKKGMRVKWTAFGNSFIGTIKEVYTKPVTVPVNGEPVSRIASPQNPYIFVVVESTAQQALIPAKRASKASVSNNFSIKTDEKGNHE